MSAERAVPALPPAQPRPGFEHDLAQKVAGAPTEAQAAVQVALRNVVQRQGGDVVRFDQELARARAEVAAAQSDARAAAGEAQQAAAAAAAQVEVAVDGGDGGAVTILRDAQSNIEVRSGGRLVAKIAGDVPLDGDQIENIVTTAVASARPPELHRDMDHGPPPGVIQLIVLVMGLLTVMLIVFPLARAWGRRIASRGTSPAAPSPDVTARLERIEHAVESVAIEVERISEAQRFSARLLAERAPEALPQARDARAVEPAGGAPYPR